MSLELIHQEYIIEKLHKEYLYDGIIPTSDMLKEDLDTYKEEHPDLSKPTSSTTEFNVERGSNASASLIETIKSTVDSDVGIATKETYRIATEAQRFYDRWSIEMNRLEAKSAKLEQRVDSLLLLSEDTLGFFAFVGDVFTDMNSINTELTTAQVNLRENTISINPDRKTAVDSSGGSLIDLSELTENDITFTPLSTQDGTAYFSTNKENALYKIFYPENSSWVGKVIRRKTGSMTCELKAAISRNKDVEVSRVAMTYSGPNGTSRATVTLQYSADGYTWYLVPSSTATKSLGSRMSWTFPLTKMRWAKFIFTKPAPDNTNNEYIFSADSIRFYGQVYNNDVGNTFIGNSLSALDKNDSPILFSKVALLTCEEIPTNTAIKYFISGSKDDEVWTNWFSIAPISFEGISYPKVVNIGGADWKDNEEEDDVDKFDTTVSQKIITRTFDSSYQGYRFKNSEFGTINSAISVSVGEDPNPIGNSVVVWRNTRYKEAASYPDMETVREISRGWGLDGSQYSCYFEIIDSNGTVIDFGDNECELNGQKVSGIVNIPAGVHKFITRSEFWNDISESIAALSGEIETEEALENLDPLYPYNHKLLIEGFPYATAFKGEKKYKGTDISAEFYCKKVSLFDLENNIEDLGYFAMRGVGDEANPTLAVILRYNAGNSDFSSELCSIRWRSGDANATMYKYIKLKAVLSTQDVGISPVLNSYRIKLGL